MGLTMEDMRKQSKENVENLRRIFGLPDKEPTGNELKELEGILSEYHKDGDPDSVELLRQHREEDLMGWMND